MIIGFRKFIHGALTDSVWLQTKHFREIIWSIAGKGAMRLIDSDGRGENLEPEEASQLGGRLLIDYPMPNPDGTKNRSKSARTGEPELIAYTADSGNLTWLNLDHWSRIVWRPDGGMQLFPSYHGRKKTLSITEANLVGPLLTRSYPMVQSDGRKSRIPSGTGAPHGVPAASGSPFAG